MYKEEYGINLLAKLEKIILIIMDLSFASTTLVDKGDK